MIPPLLIIGTTVGGTQVKRVVDRVLQPEGDAHKTAGSGKGSWSRRPGNLCLDDAIGELEALCLVVFRIAERHEVAEIVALSTPALSGTGLCFASFK